ncbi:MAG: HDOD domain-containing protein [Gammaproteobacteria bacterium]|nr:HDOD domain-containing protein [Gammaproteobacteria bacterium]
MQTSAASVNRSTHLSDIMVARQPILDRNMELFAYELLYRSLNPDHAMVRDGDAATSSVLLAAFMDIGLERLASDRPVFINATRNFLLSRHALALPPERVVIEILEDVQIDTSLVEAVQELAEAGFRIALDDFVFAEHWQPLIELAGIIKVDVLGRSSEAIEADIAVYRRPGLQLLAEKVETHEAFESLLALGFDYFQGFYFARPKVLSGATLSNNRLLTLNLLSQLQDPSTDIDDVARLVSMDAALSYRLMRFINSAMLGLSSKVTSIHRAVVLIGLAQIKRWVSLMVLSSVDGKPAALINLAIVRGRFCEELARRDGAVSPDSAFTVGLLSCLDALLDKALEELVVELPLSSELVDALLGGCGPLGRILHTARAFEQGDWGNVGHARLGLEAVSKAYSDAVAWVDAAGLGGL